MRNKTKPEPDVIFSSDELMPPEEYYQAIANKNGAYVLSQKLDLTQRDGKVIVRSVAIKMTPFG